MQNGSLKVKTDVPDDLLVEYDGVVYYPYQYILGFTDGKPTHTAVLHDLTVNSVSYADLERVEKCTNKQ
jgi:hypothetical protein